MISKFRSIVDTAPLINLPLSKALEEFRTGGDYVNLINQIRATPEKSDQYSLKRKLPAYTFAGTFAARAVTGLLELSGYVQLEYDNVVDVIALKDALNSDKYTAASCISVSGCGVWLLVKVDNLTRAQDYKEAFNQLCKHYSNYGELDLKISDVSRVRYLSMDPQLYINEYSTVYFYIQPPTKEETTFIRNLETSEPANLSWWSAFLASGNYAGIVTGRHDWLRFGMAMKHAGLPFEDFDTISQQSPGYVGTEDCRKVWNETPKNVTAGTLIYFVTRLAGFKIPKNSGNLNTSPTGERETKYQKMERLVLSEYVFVLNSIHDCIEWRAASGGSWTKLNDRKVEGITYILNRAHDLNVGVDKVRSFINGYVDSHNLAHNPIVDALSEVREFSEFDVFEKVASCLGASDKSNVVMYLRKWFCASVINITRELRDKSNELCLILRGKQGSGKNTFVDHISSIWKSEYILTHFGAVDTKDFSEKLHKAAIIYMDELSALSKTTGIEEVKSVLSQNTVSYRKSYGREISEYKVYANFIGSTNESHFLADQTGNRRFLVIDVPVDRIDFDCMPSAEEIWGYAKYLVRTGKEHGYFKHEEMLLVHKDNEGHAMVRDHVQILEEVIDIDGGIPMECKALYLRDYLNELVPKTTSAITSNRLMKDLRSRYSIDAKTRRGASGTEKVIAFGIAKEHYDRFVKLINTRYNRDIGTAEPVYDLEPVMPMPF